MLMQLKVLTLTICSSMLLLLVLCLGAQNLNDREKLRLGLAETAPLPSGFLVGISLVLGVISGGSAAALFLPDSRH